MRDRVPLAFRQLEEPARRGWRLTCLRYASQGKGEFTMEYSHHAQVPREVQEELTAGFSRAGGHRAAASA
jgi:hypothetical protein